MTTRKRTALILILAIAVVAGALLGCDGVELVTGDNGANHGHYLQTCPDCENAVPGALPTEPPPQVAERTAP